MSSPLAHLEHGVCQVSPALATDASV